MGTKKFRLLKAVAIICFIFAIIEFGLGVFTIVSPYADENVDQLIQATKEDDNTNLADLNEEEYSIVHLIVKIILSSVYFIECFLFILEGFLIYRAIKKGKTTFITIILIIGLLGQLVTLIIAAVRSTYDFNSASSLIAVIIRTIILRQIFEIRRLNAD
ncbi:MAG: hypothetical protein IKF83_00015 [Clostridia bacterium]|nr:hypothetical protein [Clostridia bacterium]